MLRKLIFYMPLMGLLALSISSYAEIYKWVDEHGNTQYTQRPPPGDIIVETVKIRSKTQDEQAQKILNKTIDGLQQRREKRAEEKLEQQKQLAETAQKKARCQQARSYLKSYQRPRVAVKEDDGSIRRLGEDERQQQIAEGQKLVQEACE